MARNNGLWNAPGFVWIETNAEYRQRLRDEARYDIQANYGDIEAIDPEHMKYYKRFWDSKNNKPRN